MRYVTVSILGFAMATGLSSPNLRAVDVEVDVNLNARADVDISVFNDQLSPHGKWLDVAEYGRVWQPNECATDTEWRPYMNDGHWTWTDGGWYWESSYAWGWAAFHYGRWNHDDKYNWVWSPDVTWAPAWVSWRQSDSVYGWAPLPHGSRFEGGVLIGGGVDVHADFYNFVPAHSFLTVNLSTVAIPRAQHATVYNETKIVNNSYVYNDNRVINNGIPVKQVAAVTHQEITPVKIADAKSPTEKGGAGKIAAYRPAIKEVPASKTEVAKPTTPNAKAPAETAAKPEAKPADPTAKPAEVKPEVPKAKAPEPKQNEAKPTEPKAKQPDVNVEEPKAKAPEPKQNETKPVEPKAKPSDVKAEEPKVRAPEPKQDEAKPVEPKAKPAELKEKPAHVKPEEPRADHKQQEAPPAESKAKPDEPKAKDEPKRDSKNKHD
jgi:hypothetical protein